MKKVNIYILLAILLSLPVGVSAQQLLPDALTTENPTATREEGNVVLSTTIKTGNLHLKSQEMVYVTPILYSADSSYRHHFDPIIIAGATRYKVLQRNIKLNNVKFERTPQAIVKYNKHKEQSIPVTMNVPYQSWMDNSKLVLHEDLTGCACENEARNTYLVMTPVLPARFVPRFEVAYITPPKEEIKQRSETYAAHINFEVARHVILPNYKNNAEVLGKVDEIIKEIQNDANLRITGFKITGYASPEGNQQSNLTLSKNRAEAFVLYLINKYKMIPSEISTDWKGEDWDGLREIVAQSNMPDKQNVLYILDNESNVLTRKAKLQQLSGGAPYKMMLREYYPSLRRNEYTISFTVKEFDLDEARAMMASKPQYLSQLEMYRVAQSYPRNSSAYNEAFQTIAKYYPNDDVAVLNSSAADLENGMTDSTLQKLERINKPEAWNNLGIAYFEKKDYQKAKTFFSKAADAGSSTAASNLNQLNKYIDSKQ